MNRHQEQASLNGFKRDTQEAYSEPDEKQADYDEDEGSMDGSEFNSDIDPYLDGREEEEEDNEYTNNENQNNQGYQQAHKRLGDILDSDDNEESQVDEGNEEIDSSPDKTAKYGQQQQQYQSRQLNGYSKSSNSEKDSKQYTKQTQMQRTQQYQNSQYENQQHQVNSQNQPIQRYKQQQKQYVTKSQQQNSYSASQQQQQKHQQQPQQQQQKKPTTATTPQQKDSREYNSSKSIMEPTTTTFPSTRKVFLESGVPLGFSIHPFGFPSQDSKDSYHKGVIVGFKKKKDHIIPTLNEEDISRCTSCGTIVNPFCEIIVSLSKWKCNMCFNVMAFPRVYKEAVPNVRGMRLELQYGSYDVILPDKYRARRDEYQVFWFMLDVSESSTASGILKSSCEAIKNALASESLQYLKNSQSNYAQIGIIGYDHELHLYKINSKTGRGQLFISKDLEEQLDQPSLDTLRILEEKAKENNNNNGSSAGLLSKLSEKISFLQQNQQYSSQPIEPSQQPLLEYDIPFPGDILMPFNSTASEQSILSLLDSLETMYTDRHSKKQQELQQQPTHNTANTASPPTSIFLKALDFSLENLKFTGGRLFVFHGRDTILQPANGIDYTGYSISSKLKDTFISISICYVDFPGLPSKLSTVLRDGVKQTNGVMLQVQDNHIHSGYYTSYMTKVMSAAFAWNSVVRFRCTKGWSIANVTGNIQLRSNTFNLFNLNATSQANLLVEVQNELVKNEINYFCLQSCVMFTNENQERIMRVHNYILPLSSNYADIYKGINPKVLAMHIAKKQLELILSQKVSEREAESALINMLKKFVQKMLQNNRSSLTETAESTIMTVLGYLKQKSLIAYQQTGSQSSHSLMGPLIELLGMGNDEFESMCTPLIFDVEELLQNHSKSPENSQNHPQHNNKSNQFSFPSLIHPSYISIHNKSIMLVDFGQESILFINSQNVTSEILMSVFETDDLNSIASITQEQFFKSMNPNVAQIKLLLLNIQHLKKQTFMNSFSIVVSDTQNTKEFMLYYKLIMDKYEYFEGAYDNSFDDMIAILLKPL